MSTKNITPIWDVAHVFRIIFHNQTPEVFANHFQSIPYEQQQMYKTMRDGMKQDFLGQAVSLGKRQWVQWFLDNEWPVTHRDFSLIKSLLHQEKIEKFNENPKVNQPLHLGDLMHMMTPSQWKDFCHTLWNEKRGDLVAAFKNGNKSGGTHKPMSHFSNALKKDEIKQDIFKTHIEDIALLCRHHIYLLGEFDNLNWDISTLTGYWNNPISVCVDKMLTHPPTREVVDDILSSSWFEQILALPSSTAYLSQYLDTNSYNENVWSNLLSCEEHPITAHKIMQRILDTVSLECDHMLQLQTNLTASEKKYGLTPAGDTLKAFLSKQIITASLSNSVKGELLTEKKSFKKM